MDLIFGIYLVVFVLSMLVVTGLIVLVSTAFLLAPKKYKREQELDNPLLGVVMPNTAGKRGEK